MNLQVGDKCKVIDRKAGHKFDIGEIVEIIEVAPDYRCSNKDNDTWWLTENELERIEIEETESQPVNANSQIEYIDLMAMRAMQAIIQSRGVHEIVLRGESNLESDCYTAYEIATKMNAVKKKFEIKPVE